MSAAEARAMADEQIAWWRCEPVDPSARIRAHQAWSLFSSAPYPGGGWERVRAKMVDWLLDVYAPYCAPSARRAA